MTDAPANEEFHVAEWIVLTDDDGDPQAFPDQQQAERYAAEHGGVAVGVADNVVISEAEQQEDTVVSGPLPEDRTTVAGSTGSFNTTDRDRALMWDGPADQSPTARAGTDDQATIEAYLKEAEADYWREDGYGSNGKGADYYEVQLEDAKDHGYRQYDGNGHG